MTALGSQAGVSGAIRSRAGEMFKNLRACFAVLMRPPRPTPVGFVPAWRRFWWQALIAVVAIALSMALIDTPISGAATKLPTFVVDAFYDVTDFGRSGWVLIPVGGAMTVIILLASPALDPMGRAVLAALMVRLGFVFLAVGLPGLIVTIVKRWIGRVRPSSLGPFAYEPFSWRPEFASFPSGHATTAFAALVAIGAVAPRARPFLWAYAVLIAASRIAVVAHYPSDVIAGAACGAFGALLVRDWFAVRRLGFHIGSDGRVHADPGLSWRRARRVAGVLLAP
jgi:membrane-associated phospholipid phosphatase